MLELCLPEFPELAFELVPPPALAVVDVVLVDVEAAGMEPMLFFWQGI